MIELLNKAQVLAWHALQLAFGAFGLILLIAITLKVAEYHFLKGGKFLVTAKVRKLLRSWVPPQTNLQMTTQPVHPKIEHKANQIIKRTVIMVRDGEIHIRVPKATRFNIFGTEAQVLSEIQKRLESRELKDFLAYEFPDASFSALESNKHSFDIHGS